MQPAAAAAASAASDLCGGAVVQIVECVRYAAELAVGRGRFEACGDTIAGKGGVEAGIKPSKGGVARHEVPAIE
jgi:hypothetical protein